MRTDLIWVALGAFALGACAAQVATKPEAQAHDGPHTEAVVKPVEQLPARAAASGKAWVHTLVEQDDVFIGRLHLAAGAKVPLHADPDLEVIYVLQGQGQLTMDGTSHEVGPGSAIVMPPGAEVSYTNGKLPFVAVQVFAPGSSANKYKSWASRS